MVTINGIKFTHGMRIRCKIDDRHISNARLSIDGNRLYICHNEQFAEGNEAPQMFGYRFSWVFQSSKDGLTEEVSNIQPLLDVNFKDDIKISSDITRFLHLVGQDLALLFEVKCGIFDEFHIYDKSPNNGFIILSNDKKKVEIKISRFIRQVSSNIELILGNEMKLTDHDIEKLYNKWVAFQNNEMLKVTILTGKDILKAYTKENYISDFDSTLTQSCMTDKHDYLSLYTDNPCISLAVLFIEDKVAARCLIWETEDGKYFDRIYYQHDWMCPLIESALIEMGYKSVQNRGGVILSVKLQNCKFDYYPYLDSFCYLDEENSKITTSRPETTGFKLLRRTDGESEQY